MKIVVTGGTGFIGKRVIAALRGDIRRDVVVFTRKARPDDGNVRYVVWDPKNEGPWQRELDGAETVINLAGEGLYGHRWTPQVKRELQESRVISTQLLVQAIGKAEHRPSLLISASAAGFYGPRDGAVDEGSSPGKDFLATLCVAWEREALKAEMFDCRVVCARLGVVLSPDGGALRRLLPVFKAFLGGPLGTGEQWFPWVHVDDAVRALLFPMGAPMLSGGFNVVAPESVRMLDFCKELGAVLNRPSWLELSPFALKLGLGEEGAEALLTGQKVNPRRLQAEGFTFYFPSTFPALTDLLGAVSKPEPKQASAART